MSIFHPMQNSLMPYAWGNRSKMLHFLGKPLSSGPPLAELWMGTHPRGMSLYTKREETLQTGPLTEILQGHALSFLFKVLAVEKALSIQVHPNVQQARKGWEEEEQQKIPGEAPERNFKDANHKPELLCALSSFQLLAGFRPLHKIQEDLNQLGIGEHFFSFDRVEPLFRHVMTLSVEAMESLLRVALPLAQLRENKEDRVFEKLVQEHGNDPGVLAAYLLHYIELTPGEALYTPPGRIHCYLQGLGLEVMAASDNVLRGGLTGKHKDTEKLLQVLSFDTERPSLVLPEWTFEGLALYPTPARDFSLSFIQLYPGNKWPLRNTSKQVRLFLCSRGQAVFVCESTGEVQILKQGESLCIPPETPWYTLQGQGKIHIAEGTLA